MNAIGYVRCASENKRTLERQQREICEYCRDKGWKLASVYGDTGKYGSGLNPDRPGLIGALAELGRGDVLIITSPDRLSRKIDHLLTLQAQIKEAGAELICVYVTMRVFELLGEQ